MGITNDGESVPGTTISGNIMFDCPVHGDNNLILEGIHFQSNRCWVYHLKNATISKCKFDKFSEYSTDTEWDNLSFTNCIISDMSFPYTPIKSSINFINCVLEGYINVRNSDQSSYLFDHCVFYTENGGNYFNNSTISNSILSNKCNNSSTSKGQIYNNCTVNNSVITGYSFNLPEGNNLFPETTDDIFASEGFYEPSESLKEFKTNDGSQVGIHGGSMKFNAVPSVPQITKFNVSSKTTADGKLSVDIEVKSAQ